VAADRGRVHERSSEAGPQRSEADTWRESTTTILPTVGSVAAPPSCPDVWIGTIAS